MTNKTSLAVEMLEMHWQDEFPMPSAWPAIAQKFKRMEEALQDVIAINTDLGDNENDPLNAVSAAVKLIRRKKDRIANEAIAFDPLS